MGVAVWPMVELEADDALASAAHLAAADEDVAQVFLALVGDAADGYPGIGGIGRIGAARLIEQHGKLEDFPPEVLGKERDRALLFKDLATLRSDARLFADVEELRWRGPTAAFAAFAAQIGDAGLLTRALRAAP